ncbi:ChbG/HpnK family deacetylase [Fluviicola sp.]|uniref:ChbG/HpnK family deacetylase n=1 Tax=Fluviicola sp. TaxID=1917219 RepID=UPI003D291A85
MSKLILTADDYGLNPGVNEGTLFSVRRKTVTSVQVLANMATEDQIRELASAINESGNLCGIGLHFCTTFGPSVVQKETSFTEKIGDVYHFRRLQNWAYHPSANDDMAEELTAQFNKLKNIIGGERIDSFSSHQNVHLFDEYYCSVIAHLGEEHKVPARSPLRWDQVKGVKHFPEKGADPIKLAAVKALAECLHNKRTALLLTKGLSENTMERRQRILKEKAGGTPHSMCGHWYGQPLKMGVSWLVDELERIRDKGKLHTTELLMHLSNSAEGDTNYENYKMDDRRKEFGVLNTVEMMNYIHSLYERPNFVLGSYRKVVRNETVTYDL